MPYSLRRLHVIDIGMTEMIWLKRGVQTFIIIRILNALWSTLYSDVPSKPCSFTCNHYVISYIVH